MSLVDSFMAVFGGLLEGVSLGDSLKRVSLGDS